MLTRAEQKIHDIVDAKLEPIVKEVSGLISRQKDIVVSVAHIQTNTDALVKVTIGAGKLSKLAKKHGPRLFAFALGIAVSSGLIDPAVAANIRGLFGL